MGRQFYFFWIRRFRRSSKEQTHFSSNDLINGLWSFCLIHSEASSLPKVIILYQMSFMKDRTCFLVFVATCDFPRTEHDFCFVHTSRFFACRTDVCSNGFVRCSLLLAVTFKPSTCKQHNSPAVPQNSGPTSLDIQIDSKIDRQVMIVRQIYTVDFS